MKRWSLCLGMVLALSSAVWGQKEEQKQAPPAAPQQQPQPQRPTLGPAPPPSLAGPRTSTTTDARRLMHIRTIFVERMDNSLSEKLADGLSKRGPFRVVASRNEADAVLRGTCFDSRRLKSVHAEVYLNERTNGASVWQDSVRQSYNPPPLEKVVSDTATLILAHLTESIQEAQRK